MSVHLKHPTLTNCNLTIVTPRRYKAPFACLVCDTVHTYKTYHLKLDSQGGVDVSDEVYEQLAELDGLPLKKGPKRKPKPQRLEMPPAGGYTEILRPHTELFVPKSMREKVDGNGKLHP